jgi:eukaryotic-like serine/threonine-protein kinase
VQIGPYQVLLELGRGGMGTVYLARLVGAGGFERLVAIKRAHPGSMGQDNQLERFLREARLAASIHHANVVGIHQIGEDHAGPYLACEYVEGEALSGLIEQSGVAQPMPTPIALRVVLDALAGLHAAHETQDTAGRSLGILHRDVSIENLLVGRDGVTRLTDFGIAKSAVGPGLTEAGTIHGKLMYLTPEVLGGAAGARSDDTYAMGVTLWIALVGAFPYRARDNAALVHQVLETPIPRLAHVGVDTGPLLEAALARAVSHTREARFQTAREMLDALEAVSKRESPAARHLDVADFVERAVGAKLSARRAQIHKQLGHPPLEPKAAAATAALPDHNAANAVAVILDTQPAPLAQPAAGKVRQPSRLLIAAALAALSLALLVLGTSLFSARSVPADEVLPGTQPKLTVPQAERPRAVPSGAEPAPKAAPVTVEVLHDAAPSALRQSTADDAGAPRPRPRGSAAHTPPKRADSEVPAPPGLDIATDNPYR